MRTYPYSSTHRIEQVSRGKLRKDLSLFGRLTPVSPRPRAVENPAREPSAYRNVLAPLGIGPRLIDSGRDWVVIEKLDACELWQVGDVDVWIRVAAWLAWLHTSLAQEVEGCRLVPLLDHVDWLYQLWHDRAVANGLATVILEAHRRATDHLLGLPRTVIHGDLYASNILVEQSPRMRFWPIDWELVGVGPAVLDLAALTAGSWSSNTRAEMARSYFDASNYPGGVSQGMDDLCAARLHLCVQWLGAPPDWTTPPIHRHDWLAEAHEMAALL